MNFKKFLEAKKESEYIYSYRDKHIIRTNHQKDRYKERNTSNNKTIDLFKKSIKWLITHGKTNKNYAFISKSSKLGMMIVYRPDKKQKDKHNQVILITWFGNIEKDLKSKEKKTPENFKMKYKSDIKVLVEAIDLLEEMDLEEIVFI